MLQEFYVQATRPTRTNPLTHQEATALIQYWLRHRIVPITVQVMLDALDIKKRYQTSYWDAAILAAVAGCTKLLSEDLNSYEAASFHFLFFGPGCSRAREGRA